MSSSSEANVWPPVYTDGNLTLPEGATLLESAEQWSAVEKFAIAFGVFVYFLTALAAVVLNVYGRVPYVKIVGLPFVNAIVVCSILFWVSVLTNIRLIPQTGAFLACTFWNLWLFYVSVVTLLTALVARLWRLDMILLQRRAAVGWRAWLLPVAIWSPCIVYCIVGSIVGADGPYTFPQNGWAMCYLSDALQYTAVGHFMCIMIVYITLAVRLRQARSRIFNEYWDSIVSFVAFVICIVVYVGLVFKLLQYLPGGRAGISIVVTIINNVFLWAFLFRPVYNVLFRHQAALHAFKEAMSNKKIVLDDDVHNSNSSIYQSHRIKRAAKDAGDWLNNWFSKSMRSFTGSGTLSHDNSGTFEMRSAASQSATDLNLKSAIDIGNITVTITSMENGVAVADDAADDEVANGPDAHHDID